MGTGRRFWGMLLAAIGAVALVAAGFVAREQAREDAERNERLRIVTTITALRSDCPDDRRPFHIVIRNLASRTLIEATIQFAQDPLPVGTLPSDIPTVSLKTPLPPGQRMADCYALNRTRLFAHGLDPRATRWQLPRPVHVVFE